MAVPRQQLRPRTPVRDPRFGGNMARANEGAQYVGSPRDNNVAAPTWQPGRNWEDSKTTDWKYRGRDPEGNIQATWRTNRSGPEGTGGISWDDFYRDNNFGRDYWDEHGYLTGSPRQRTEFKSGPMSSEFFNEMYPTYDDQIMRGQRGRDYQNKLGTAWPSQGEFGGWKSKSPVPYEAHPGTGYGDEEGEFGGIDSLQSKINLQDMFRRYPGLDMWQLIQNLDKRGIEYANRGGIMGVI